jgi:hypothetical protein
MPPSTPDLSATVEYSVDRWRLKRVPWAMWACVAGLAIVLHADRRGANGALLAFVYLALLGLAFAGWAATTLIEREISFLAALVIGLAIVVVVAMIIAVVTGTVGRTTGYRGTLWWSRLVDPPFNVFGWMLLYLGGGFIAYALVRHARPSRPILMLTPAGVAFHRPWLSDVFIPWQDVQGVGPLEIARPGLPASTHPNAIAVTVTSAFYDRHIAPKRSVLAPPGSEMMFQPKDAMMQMVVTSHEVAVAPENYRVPMEARWQAFRDRPVSSVPQIGAAPGPRVVYGRWSFDGSWRQTIMFLAPLVGLAAVVLHATGLWPV